MSTKQEAFKARYATKPVSVSAPHVIVKAGAGTGKTTTMISGLQNARGGKPSIVPSDQQRAIWDQIALSKDAHSIGMIAFSKAIATEAQKKVPPGVDAMTTHSMAFRAVTKAFGRVNVNGFRVDDIVSELTGIDIYELKKKSFEMLSGVRELVKHCKSGLCDPTVENLDALASYYDVEMNGSRSQVFDLVPRVLERCKDVQRDGRIDFNDMIWLPIILDLPMFKYDLLLVDESQDLNRCQQAIARRCGKRLILVGDEKQAIFGFAGADAESMDRMERELGETPEGVITLPLNKTRRCAKRIVEEANKIFPDFYAHEDNPLGEITQAAYKGDGENAYFTQAKAGDAVLCRVNAPLVMQAFRFLKAGRRAEILGRDIAEGLIRTIKKMNAPTIPDLIQKLGDWLYAEQEKENRKRNPSESRIINLQDRHDCIVIFTEGCITIDDVISKVDAMFSDKSSGGVVFSTVHKAKGLEWDRVFLMEPKGAGIPHPIARTPQQLKGEWCLRFVAITRAIRHLTYVREE